jgi:hypothetical protein
VNATETFAVIVALTALLASLCAKGSVGQRYHGKPAIAQTGEEQQSQDDSIVGDSGTMCNPISLERFANTRWNIAGDAAAVTLRQVSRGGPVHAQINGD